MSSRLNDRMNGRGQAQLNSRLFSSAEVVSSTLWSFDLSAVALGAGSIADPSATFFRASGGGSVQTSATTVVTAGLTNDVPRYGYDGACRGLVIECARTDLALRSREMLTADGWLLGPGMTADFIAGPDGGSTGDRANVASGATSNYQTVSVTNAIKYVAGAWFRHASGSGTGQFVLNTGASPADSFAVTSAWARRTKNFTASATASVSYIPVDGRDWTGSGGTTAGARDIVCDLHQVEAGAYPTEAIVTTTATATRAGERLNVAAAKIVSASRVEIQIDLYAKGAATEYAGDGAHVYLLFTDASNYIRIDTATRRLQVAVAGATWSPVTALTWARGDRVTFRVAAGGGSIASRASYSVNGGAYTDLGTTAAQGTWPATASDVCSAATASQLSCWLRSVTTYVPGGMP